MTEQKIANPCMERKLFHTEFYYSTAIHEDGTNRKKNKSITKSKITRYNIYFNKWNTIEMDT